ncbi:MAG: extracellular solute-binding protein [Actinobacteria bacterium]|nr:extracellular solute-binding protein [Actinomycetota bacterium]
MCATRSRLAAGAALAALALTACGGSPTATNNAGAEGDAAPASRAESVYAELSALAGQERRDELVKRAEEEGALTIYTSMTSDVADAVVEAFEDTFDLDVSLYRAGSETVLQRVLQEQKASFAGNDVIETNATELFALASEGVLGDYQGERRGLVPEAGKFEGWTATRFNLFSPSWNTELVKDIGAPKSWEDLADPKYDGKLSMEVGDYDWYLTLYKYWQEQGKSEAEIDKLFADMADGAKIVKGHTVQGELLSAGQFAVVASNYTYLVERVKAKGAPVDYRPLVEPVIARPNGVGLMKNATNPAAAMLFYDWLLEEGQLVLAEEGLTPSIAGEGDDPLKGVEVIPVDVEALLTESEKWTKKYEAVIQGGEQVAK